MSETVKNGTPRLTSAQRSYLKRLYLSDGFCHLSNATFQTASALHDKGMAKVVIQTPVNGYVCITEDGERVAKAIIDLLDSSVGRRDIREFLGKAEGRS